MGSSELMCIQFLYGCRDLAKGVLFSLQGKKKINQHENSLY